jgi:hypothetical protein
LNVRSHHHHAPTFQGLLNESQLPTQLAIGSQYRFAGPGANSTTLRSVANALFFQGAQGQVSYKIEFSQIQVNQQPPPDGDVLINSATGSLFITPTIAFSVTIVLSGFDESGRAPVQVATWTFSTLPADVDNSTHGPNGRGCGAGSPVDATEFDNIFTCNCTEGFTGDNCDVADLPQLIIEYHGSLSTSLNPSGLNPGNPGDRRRSLQQLATKSGDHGNHRARRTTSAVPCSVLSFSPPTRSQWAIGRAYHINSANITSVTTSGGLVVAVTNVTYSLSPNPPGFFIDVATGAILGQPTVAYNGTSALKASVSGTQPAILTNITFEFLPDDTDDVTNGPNGAGCGQGSVVDAVEFDFAFVCDCGASFTGDNCETQVIPQLLVNYHGTATPPPTSTTVFTPLTRAKWAIGSTYEMHVANISLPRTAGGDTFNVSDVKFQLDPNPAGFFVDGDTAAMLGKPPSPLNVTSVLRATVDGTLSANLQTIVFEFLFADVENTAFGPGGAGCLNGGAPVDTVEFDNAFTCNCVDTGHFGSNCEILSDLPDLRIDVGEYFYCAVRLCLHAFSTFSVVAADALAIVRRLGACILTV